MSDYDVDLRAISSGWNGTWFWAQARAGAIPATDGGPATVVMTAQSCLLSGSDVFGHLCEWRSDDGGETWDGPLEHKATLGRRVEPDGATEGVCDMTPAWHAATGTLLSTGHTVAYSDDKHPITNRRRGAAYSVYDPATRTWTAWATIAVPDREDFVNLGAGSAQRVDLPDGDILLPVYFKPRSDNWHACMSVTVLRCGYDGKTLTYKEHGSELTVPEPRGLAEPSIAEFDGRYYLALRNDKDAYLARGTDGLHYGDPVPLVFDDGSSVGSYCTQMHWISRPDALYLVYTRRAADNDHVFRHRAPLWVAQVDPDRLCVIRGTERAVTPNRGARTGNFAICEVSPSETWVVVAEWMQPAGCEKYGSDNTIWSARLHWT